MLNYDYNNRDLWSSSSVRSKTQSREFIAYRELRVLHLQCKSYVKLRQINRAGSRLNKSSIVVCSTRNSLLFYFVLRVIIRYYCTRFEIVYERLENKLKMMTMWRFSYLERGRNIEPSMNTEPDSSMYQLVANSPVLKMVRIIFYFTHLLLSEFILIKCRFKSYISISL